MALDLKINTTVENDCKTLVITDVTGAYSASNLNGWGGPNTNPSLLEHNLVLTVMYPIYVGEDLIPIPISFPLTQDTISENDYWEFDGPDFILGFIFKVDINHFIFSVNAYLTSNNILDLNGNVLQLSEEVFVDNIYQITINMVNFDNSVDQQFDFCFSNTCTIAEQVSLKYSSIDAFCKDCDKKDLEDAILAESLLNNLKNSCD
tara:strand:+ start:236 stop:850 length:615 start_codon:yes stop_codon:yes gene_type:complete